MTNASNKPSWRRSNARAPVAQAGKGWQAKRTRAGDSAVSNHRLKLGVLGLLLLALAAAFAITAFRRPLATPLIAITATTYAAPIPPNSFAQEDLEHLTNANPKNVQLSSPLTGTVLKQSLLGHLDKQLKNVWRGGPGKNIALIYLSAHGVVDGSGNPCLLLSDSQPLDTTTWLTMSELLAVLNQRSDLKKVLFLDTTRLDDAWGLGVLYNGFTEQLGKELAAKPIPDLFVVSSSSEGERSWAAPEVGASAFGHYLAKGLQGAASRNDKQITLRELTTYVAGEVSGHVRRHRATSQSPKLLTPLPENHDFAIAYSSGNSTGSDGRKSRSDGQRIASQWAQLNDHWKQLEAAFERQASRYEPVRVSRIEQSLIRLEQLLLSGKAYAKEYTELENRVRGLLEGLTIVQPDAEADAYSLPLHAQLRRVVATDSQVVSTLARWRAADGKPPVKKEDPPVPPLEYVQAASVAWTFLTEHERPRRSHVRDLLELIDGSKPRRGSKGESLADPIEIHFLRMLDRHLDQSTPNEFPEAHVAGVMQALRNRTLAEQAAAPPDSRVHYWNHDLVNTADQARRVIEDRLFCDAGAEVSASAADPLDLYRQAVERGKEISAMLALRDDIWHGLPYLTAWLLRSPTIESVSGRGQSPEVLLEHAERIAASNHELASSVDRLLVENRVDDVASLRQLAAELKTSWQMLTDTFAEHCQELKDRGSDDRATLKEITEVLRVPTPLVSADERIRLADAYIKKMFELSQVSGAGQKSSADESVPGRLNRLARFAPHPALRLLDRSSFTLLLKHRQPEPPLERGEASDIEWLAQQGERIRSRLATVQDAARDLEDDTKNRLKEALETAANTRAGISESDRLVRAATPFTPQELSDPSVRLERVDRYFQMLWHGYRTIEDFWGPSKESEGSAASYFAQIGAAYLAAARQFDETPTSPMYGKTNLRDLLAARVNAAQGIRLEPQDIRTLGESETASQDIHIQWPENLPVPGIGALSIEATAADGARAIVPVIDGNGQTWRRQSVALASSAATDLNRQIPTGPLADASERTATFLFRGHVIRRPFDVRRPESVVVATFDPRLPPTAKVTVKGEGSRRAFITFILDCSGSMAAHDDGVQRMDAAKRALLQVLSSLQLGGNYHVSLRAYSHRYRFDNRTGPNGRFLVVDVDGKPSSGDPDRDVQILVGMDKLNQNHFEEIRTAVLGLRANGVTPLYHSIINALIDDENDFRFAEKDDLRHVIVITDGINQEQYRATTAADVMRTIDQLPANVSKRVDVVLFQAGAVLRDQKLIERLGAARIRRELADIKAIAERAGGQYFTADDPQQLVDSIREALKLVKFSVVPQEAAAAPPAELREFGQEQILDVSDGVSRKYQVQLHPKSNVEGPIVEIEGGEALELEYDKSRDRLVFRPYERAERDGRPLKGDFVDPITRERYNVTPILPVKSLNRVQFEIAIQNVNLDMFTARPKNVWVGIQPRTEADEPVGTMYCFTDAQFAEGTPVPVLQFIANDWPRDATWAAVQMWFKYDNPPIKPNGTSRMKALEPVTIEEDVPDVTFTAELTQPSQASREWRVMVVERHEPGTDLFTARVQARPTADRVSHRYFVGVDEVRHEFDYKGDATPVVVVTARDRIRDQAVAVPMFKLPIREGSR